MDIVEKLRDTYDRIAVDFSKSAVTPWPFTKRILDQLPVSASILDLGCGNGRLLNHTRTDLDYLGVDFSETILAQARKLHPKSKFLTAQLTNPDSLASLSTYDAVFSIGLIHHFPNKIDHIRHLKAIYDHLKPGGIAVVSFWHLWRFNKLRFHLASFLAKFRNPSHLYIPYHNQTPRFFYAFTKDELLSYALKLKFKDPSLHQDKDNFFLTFTK